MSGISKAMEKKGYAPLSDNGEIGIGFEGKLVKACWMWTRKLMEYECGTKRIKTAKVSNLKDMGLHCWKDGWIPVEPFTDEFVSEMEDALREHAGLTNVPDGRFLKIGTIPAEFMGPVEGLVPVSSLTEERAKKIEDAIARRIKAELAAAKLKAAALATDRR